MEIKAQSGFLLVLQEYKNKGTDLYVKKWFVEGVSEKASQEIKSIVEREIGQSLTSTQKHDLSRCGIIDFRSFPMPRDIYSKDYRMFLMDYALVVWKPENEGSSYSFEIMKKGFNEVSEYLFPRRNQYEESEE